jgi:fermentation-respiration switch protein FrsA (DUF1100 family)
MSTQPSSKAVVRPTGAWLRRLGLTVVGTYAAVCALVCVFQARLIYFPSRVYWATPSDVGLEFEALTLEAEDGISIAAWHVPHDDARGSILFCHGNAGNIADRLHSVKLLHELGYNVLIFDYRGFGESGGSPSEFGLYMDAEAAWLHLVEDRRVQPQQIVVFGRSLGGAVAIELAGRHNPGGLVVESTFTSIADVGRIHFPLLPVNLLLTNRFESIEKVGVLPCPKLFLHGSEDELIPLAVGRRLFEAAAPPKQFIQTPGGHGDAGFTYSPEFTSRLGAFLETCVEGTGG